MKRFSYFLLAALLMTACSRVHVSSPDNSLRVSFRLNDTGSPQYSVQQDGVTVIEWSALGLRCDEANLTHGFRLLDSETQSRQDEWETVWGEERVIEDKHNELDVALRHRPTGIEMHILFRVFDDGFAFRYVFPQEGKELTVLDEKTEYRFTDDHEAWSIPWRTEYYEGIWTKAPLSEKQDTLCSPITMELTNGRYAFVHEAALEDYPAQNLYVQDGALRTYLTPWLEDGQTTEVKAYETMPFKSPWRFVILARDLPQMVASRIMLNLNEPCKIEDTSWIRPMKFIGIWWGMHMKSMTWEQGPKHGATTANMARYLRFAKEHGIEAVLAEEIGRAHV